MKEPVSRVDYSVLLRTFNSEATLPETLECLRHQTALPSEYVFIDSGSTDGTLRLVPADSKVHAYVGRAFNYSEALNQGLTHVSKELVLMLSTHTSLANSDAIAFALELLSRDARVAAAYFDTEGAGGLRATLINRDNFDGFNGIWNTCAIIRTSLLRRRGFRREVFAAEDQEWTRWLLSCGDMVVARISGAGMDNYSRNRDLQQSRTTERKRLNEYVAIAYFVNRKLLGVRNLARVGAQIVRPWSGRFQERRFHALLLLRLIACRFAMPGARV
jgi:glycosyltransferase involved in cell wall biosynthesis